MIRIAYFVHGRGRGHAVRARAVTASLRTSYDLRLFCAGQAWDLLSDVPSSEPVLACLPGKGMARSFGLRVRGDRIRLRTWGPDLLVSDGDGPSVHAARSLGIPVVAVGHGLIFRHTDAGDVLPFRTRAREIFNVGSSSWPAKRRVAVHFAPAEPLTPGTRVARPDLREDIAEGVSREDFILGYFRDDNGVEALEQVARRGHRVLLFGQPRSVPRGVEVLPLNMSSFSEALGRCRAVIGSAGNHLPAECAMLGIPMLALHRTDDAEHAMNARLVEAAGIGIGSSFERCTLEIIRRFEAEFDKPREYLAARTRAMPPASQVVPQAIDELCRPATSRSSYGEVAGSWK